MGTPRRDQHAAYHGRFDCRLVDETGTHQTLESLDITESVLQDVAHSRSILSTLRGSGIHCAIDDFGTGFSSLSVLHQLPVHAIKIDKSFVDGCPDMTGGAALLPHIVTMGQTLGLTMIAEGIEQEYQYEYLRSIGCQIGQGYHYARPLSAEAFSSEYFLENMPVNRTDLPSVL